MTKVARAWRIAALVTASLGLAYAASAQRPSEEQIATIRAACRSDYIAHCAGVPPGGAQALACLREHLASVSPACQQAVNAAGTAAPAPAAPAPAEPAPAAAAPPAPAAEPPAIPSRAAAALERMQPTQEQFGVILEACGPDIDNHCAGIERGPDWQLECLRKNAAALSTGCEQVLVAVASTAPAVAPSAPPPAPAATPTPAPAPAVAAPTPAPATTPGPRARPTREQMVAIFQSCRRDMREYCAGGGGGPGSRIRCLRENAANLSPECQEALAAVASGAPAEPGAALPRPMRLVSPREMLFLIRTSCSADVRTYCRGVEPGGGRIVRCLRENAANLSPACQEAFTSVGGRR